MPDTAHRSNRGDGVPRWDYGASGERLTPWAEGELSRRAQAGDKAARERLVQANIPLVMSVAQQYRNPYLESADLIQEGMIGLCIAVERYDARKGFRFSTYATCWIKQRILRTLNRHGRLIRVPVDVGYAARKAQVLREQLTAQVGREPTLAELAPGCGVSEERLRAVLECMDEPLSLDSTCSEEGDGLPLDVADPEGINPVEAVLQEEQTAAVEALLERLPDRDRLVLESRFGLNGRSLPLADLAERLSITREGVRQVQRRALAKLRKYLEQQEPLLA